MIGLVIVEHLSGQRRNQSADDLVKTLLQQNHEGMVFLCGKAQAEDQARQSVAKKLVEMGPVALPAIGRALSGFQHDGSAFGSPEAAPWLMLAFARLSGRSAYVRLRGIDEDPACRFLQPGIDAAIAAALDLTSYVSDSRKSVDLSCGGIWEPRDELSRLILGWEHDDRQSVQASLTPRQADRLQHNATTNDWQTLRTEYWPHPLDQDFAVGFRFLGPGWWTWLPDLPSPVNLSERLPANPEVDTIFTSRSGAECGTLRLRFVQTMRFRVEYQIDGPELAELFRVIGRCAAAP